MSIERLVVGYRPGDRRIQQLKDQHGLQTTPVRNCFGGCGYPVHFYSGGIDAARDKDAEVICTVCMDENRAEIMAAL